MRTIKPTGKRRIVSLDEAMRRVEGYEKHIPPPSVEKELFAPHEDTGSLKIETNTDHMRTFDESFQLLKEKGFERHMRPWEYAELLHKAEHGKLNKNDWIVVGELHKLPGWLSMIWKHDCSTLTCAIDPVSSIVPNAFQDSSLEFDIISQYRIHKTNGITLNFMPRSFREKIYGMSWAKLATLTRESTRIYLPEPNVWKPVYFIQGSVALGSKRNTAVSRGVISDCPF